jgi:hypothetical protein
MTWSEIVGIFKRLDSHCSDAVYLHGRYLIGEETAASHDRGSEAIEHSAERPTAANVRAYCISRSDRTGSTVNGHEAHLAG